MGPVGVTVHLSTVGPSVSRDGDGVTVGDGVGGIGDVDGVTDGDGFGEGVGPAGIGVVVNVGVTDGDIYKYYLS
tara:strand:+ start:2169 stop:2390 length:222 start_codon:yes stop_codon:yes gene_type:complete